MQTKKLIRNSIREYSKHWGVLTLFIVVVNLVVSSIVAPIISWIAQVIAKTNNVHYVSYENLLWILEKRPLAALEFFVLLLVIVGFLYLQFSILFNGIYAIFLNELTVKEVVRDSFKGLKNFRASSMLFFVLYLVVIAPVGGSFFKSPLISKAAVPQFIFESILQNPLVVLGILVGYLILLYLALRFIQVFPNMFLLGQSGIQSAKTSWQMTKRKSWSYFWRLTLISIFDAVALLVIGAALSKFQEYFDSLNSSIGLITAVIFMGVIQVASVLISVLVISVFVLMLILSNQDVVKVANTNREKEAPQKRKTKFRIFAGILVFMYIGLVALSDALYLKGFLFQTPKAIAHRGVDGANGVQNTIPVLQETSSKSHPDFVEMDIRLTKDKQFVVMHDDNLKDLAGVNKIVEDMNLDELTKLQVSENGHQALIPSFDEYLDAANQLKQPLLVELKTDDKNAKFMAEKFIQEYADRLKENNARVHSLNYKVVKTIREKAPETWVSYILPVNFTFPDINTSGYTMEETTLNSDFVDKAHDKNQQVYAWTVNDEDSMSAMMFLNVDGIITDDISVLQDTINSNRVSPKYSQRLWFYTKELNYINTTLSAEN